LSDRCYQELTCRKQDAPLFEELGFHAEESLPEALPEGAVFLVDPEAGYAHGSALEELSQKGYVFFAHYSAGCEYDGGYMASDGESFHDVAAIWHEARPCVSVNSDGSLAPDQLAAVVEYYGALARARKKLGFTT
jgi:hypothetical protein